MEAFKLTLHHVFFLRKVLLDVIKHVFLVEHIVYFINLKIINNNLPLQHAMHNAQNVKY